MREDVLPEVANLLQSLTDSTQSELDRVHLADAIEALVARSRASLSDDRSARNPYAPERSRS